MDYLKERCSRCGGTLFLDENGREATCLLCARSFPIENGKISHRQAPPLEPERYRTRPGKYEN